MGFRLRRKLWSQPIRDSARQALGLRGRNSRFRAQPRVREEPWSGCRLRLTFVPPSVNVLTLVADTSTLVFTSIGILTWLRKVEDVAGNNNISYLFHTISGNAHRLERPGKVVVVPPLAKGIQDVRKDARATSPFSTSSRIHLLY